MKQTTLTFGALLLLGILVAGCTPTATTEGTVRISGETIWCQATSSKTNHPVAKVLLPEGWSVTGGGGKANWSDKGSLLHASFPIREGNREGWEVRAKDHAYSDHATLDVWAIGIKKQK